MRRVLPLTALGLALTVGSGIALAQNTGTTGNAAPTERPYSPSNPPPQPERPTNYGWIGLLGLAGLAGLLPKRTVTPIRTETIRTDTTGPTGTRI